MVHPQRLISVVDDDRSVRRALRRLGQFAGFTADTFASAEDFLTSASLARTACLVLDIHLDGGMSGFELQAQLHADRIVTPAIFITAHCDVSTRERREKSERPRTSASHSTKSSCSMRSVTWS